MCLMTFLNGFPENEVSESLRLRFFFYKAQSRPPSSETHVTHKHTTHHTYGYWFFLLVSQYYIFLSLKT